MVFEKQTAQRNYWYGSLKTKTTKLRLKRNMGISPIALSFILFEQFPFISE